MSAITITAAIINLACIGGPVDSLDRDFLKNSEIRNISINFQKHKWCYIENNTTGKCQTNHLLKRIDQQILRLSELDKKTGTGFIVEINLESGKMIEIANLSADYYVEHPDLEFSCKTINAQNGR